LGGGADDAGGEGAGDREVQGGDRGGGEEGGEDGRAERAGGVRAGVCAVSHVVRGGGEGGAGLDGVWAGGGGLCAAERSGPERGDREGLPDDDHPDEGEGEAEGGAVDQWDCHAGRRSCVDGGDGHGDAGAAEGGGAADEAERRVDDAGGVAGGAERAGVSGFAGVSEERGAGGASGGVCGAGGSGAVREGEVHHGVHGEHGDGPGWIEPPARMWGSIWNRR